MVKGIRSHFRLFLEKSDHQIYHLFPNAITFSIKVAVVPGILTCGFSQVGRIGNKAAQKIMRVTFGHRIFMTYVS